MFELEKMFILLKGNESSFRFMFSCDSLCIFFNNHNVPTKETSVYSACGGAQRAIEMCYRNLSQSCFLVQFCRFYRSEMLSLW